MRYPQGGGLTAERQQFRILAAVLATADADGDIDWTISVDSTVVRAHQHAAGALKRGPSDAANLPITPSGAL